MVPEAQQTHKKRFLVVRARWTKSIFTVLLKCKGLGDKTIVRKVVHSVDALGYRRSVLKTDGVPAPVTVQKARARARIHMEAVNRHSKKQKPKCEQSRSVLR